MKIIKLLPGIVLPIIVALLACWLESLLPIHLIESLAADIATISKVQITSANIDEGHQQICVRRYAARA